MTGQEADERGLADMADAMTRGKECRWQCPFCGKEVPEAWSPHCGETGHAIPMEDE